MPVTDERYPVLVIGGYGVFGSRVCRRLASDTAIRLIISGRSDVAARALADDILRETPGAAITWQRLDISSRLDDAINESGAALVIHTAGPFQGRGYGVARACIAQGRHYVDLADGRAFVAGFGALDATARAAGVLAVSGASSVPAISAAAIDHLAAAIPALEDIAIAITPGNRAPRGPAVVAAILGQAGQPIRWWRGGAWATTHGWQDLTRTAVAGLGRRWLSACDVPDLTLFPDRYAGVRSVTFRAGLELGVLHLGLWALSWLVRARLIGDLAAFARPIGFIADRFAPFGTGTGAMIVTVRGRDRAGARRRASWTLRVGSGQGPWIPAMPAVILARRLARGRVPQRGAMACLDLFGLGDVMAEIGDLDAVATVETCDD